MPKRVPTVAATYPLSLGDACCDMQDTFSGSQVVRVKVWIHKSHALASGGVDSQGHMHRGSIGKVLIYKKVKLWLNW